VLVPPEDIDALGRALGDLLADPARRRAYGTEALATARRYEPAEIAERWRALLKGDSPL
jgi:glycosyltransferase involved in cell wall biosynthesis